MKRILLLIGVLVGITGTVNAQTGAGATPYGLANSFLLGQATNIYFTSLVTNGMTNTFGTSSNFWWFDSTAILHNSLTTTNQVPFTTNSAGGFPWIGGLNVVNPGTNYQNLVSSNANGFGWRDIILPYDANGNPQTVTMGATLVGSSANCTNTFTLTFQRGYKVGSPFGLPPAYVFTTDANNADQFAWAITNNGNIVSTVMTNIPSTFIAGAQAIRLASITISTLAGNAGGWTNYIQSLVAASSTP